ncbi:hypothetical protein P20652_1160 [Pseudoalteromonas sp. BSi20652]|uniref:FIST signal transduction protein n=1 Tax=Pseudoalteromonas sp. BSi20652 TaxID=388384 RepID=UPI0002318082|nr:FIST N-terminal domain-containing protein [Pseudoalteromonas sp. BSi20652]GAA59299.1 hypothetical protein P20652_1160 [Pseudoalteromonas sp. BSi20652]
MHTFQSIYKESKWQNVLPIDSNAALIFAFGDRHAIATPKIQAQLNAAFPHAEIIGCSTSGEIQGSELHDKSIALTAVSFEKSHVIAKSDNISNHADSYSLGSSLAEKLEHEGLRYVFVVSDGQLINGSELIDGITKALPESVLITGGLAGDQDRFTETVVWHNADIAKGLVILVGFYGEKLSIGHGTMGGWKPFGPMREITKSNKNTLFEIDNTPSLELYKMMLGEYANELPGSALLFPLSVQESKNDQAVVRTILSIDEDEKSMTLAGNVPESAKCQLMRANYENLVDGAQQAGEFAINMMSNDQPTLALLVSCVGRRIILDQRVEEELEIIADLLPAECTQTGFYSYGELSPLVPFGPCRLHNQTMTITLLTEN